jgi:hypothetical protein
VWRIQERRRRNAKAGDLAEERSTVMTKLVFGEKECELSIVGST